MYNFLLIFSAATMAITPPGIIPDEGIEDLPFDTTCFADAHELTNGGALEQSFFEYYGVTDTYDYLKYTAPYSRAVLLIVHTPEGVTANINVYVESKSLTIPYRTYNSVQELTHLQCVFVAQGDTIYYEISCDDVCTWDCLFYTNPSLAGATYYGYEKMYGYDMPHNGPATIYYNYHSSCYQYVEGENYTFADVLDDAIEIWESCGNIEFVKSALSSDYKIKIVDSAYDLDVCFSRNIYNNYFCSSFILPSRRQIYYGVANSVQHWDGSTPTVRECILGHAVIGFGLVLGLGLNDTEAYGTSMLRFPFLPYDGLGVGDIASFITLWGDANNEDPFMFV